MMNPEPTQEHQWLRKLLGEWSAELPPCPDAGAEAEQKPWVESARPLGPLWVALECRGEMPGGVPSTTVMTLGYDTAKGKFVGTFVGSMMTNLWVYEGDLDPSGRVLTLNTEGPNIESGQTAQFRDVIEFKSDDHRTLTSFMLHEDGEWRQFMEAHYRRTA